MKARTILALCFAVLFPVIGSTADDPLVVRDAWIREAPPNADALAGYMVIENRSDEDRDLVSASAEPFAKVMIHRTEHRQGIARMMHQEKVTIPANGKFVFEPGAYHLMLMKPTKSLRAGDHVTMHLAFGDGSRLAAMFEVRKSMPMKGGNGAMHPDHSHR